MKTKIIISTVVAYLMSYIISPYDIISQITWGFVLAILCCVPLLILNSRKFVKSSPNSMHTLVCILVCVISVLSLQVWLSYKRIAFYNKPSPDCIVFSISPFVSYGAFNMGNLWIVHASNRVGAWSNEIDYIICSEDFPKSCKYDGSNWAFEFSDDKSSSCYTSENGTTVWVDERHEVNFLGPFLGKEDLSLLRNFRYDKDLKISSPEELMTIVNKLKAEHTASVNPP